MKTNEMRVFVAITDAWIKAGRPPELRMSANELAKKVPIHRVRVTRKRVEEDVLTSRQHMGYLLRKLQKQGLIEYIGDIKNSVIIIKKP